MIGKISKYIDIYIIKLKFMKKLIFSNVQEEECCSKYFDLKGVVYYVVLINFIGLDDDGKIKYKIVFDLYKYDKRFRNCLYKFILVFEE